MLLGPSSIMIMASHISSLSNWWSLSIIVFLILIGNQNEQSSSSSAAIKWLAANGQTLDGGDILSYWDDNDIRGSQRFNPRGYQSAAIDDDVLTFKERSRIEPYSKLKSFPADTRIRDQFKGGISQRGGPPPNWIPRWPKFPKIIGNSSTRLPPKTKKSNRFGESGYREINSDYPLVKYHLLPGEEEPYSYPELDVDGGSNFDEDSNDFGGNDRVRFRSQKGSKSLLDTFKRRMRPHRLIQPSKLHNNNPSQWSEIDFGSGAISTLRSGGAGGSSRRYSAELNSDDELIGIPIENQESRSNLIKALAAKKILDDIHDNGAVEEEESSEKGASDPRIREYRTGGKLASNSTKMLCYRMPMPKSKSKLDEIKRLISAMNRDYPLNCSSEQRATTHHVTVRTLPMVTTSLNDDDNNNKEIDGKMRCYRILKRGTETQDTTTTISKPANKGEKGATNSKDNDKDKGLIRCFLMYRKNGGINASDLDKQPKYCQAKYEIFNAIYGTPKVTSNLASYWQQLPIRCYRNDDDLAKDEAMAKISLKPTASSSNRNSKKSTSSSINSTTSTTTKAPGETSLKSTTIKSKFRAKPPTKKQSQSTSTTTKSPPAKTKTTTTKTTSRGPNKNMQTSTTTKKAPSPSENDDDDAGD